MKASPEKGMLVGQQQALDAYFDELFNLEALPPAPMKATVTEAPGSTGSATHAAAVPGRTVAADDPAADRLRDSEITAVTTESLRMQIFTVAGLTLAVPLERLQAVEENRCRLTAATGHPQPVVGTVSRNGLQVPVVDTARLVLPEDRAAALGPDATERCRHLLIIDDARWVLGCSNIGDVVELTDGEVTWRTAAGKRPWLAGTAAQRRCALLDVDGLIRLLEHRMAR